MMKYEKSLLVIATSLICASIASGQMNMTFPGNDTSNDDGYHELTQHSGNDSARKPSPAKIQKKVEYIENPDEDEYNKYDESKPQDINVNVSICDVS